MSEQDDHHQLDRMITGYWVSQAIYAAARFGIADHLAAGPKTIEVLAEETGTNCDALFRLLRALASAGIFAEIEPRRFSITSLAQPLRSDVAGSKRALALMSGDEQFQAWSKIEYSIRTGQKAFDKVFGKPIFEYLGEHPDKARVFDAAMVGVHGRESDAVARAYDFSAVGSVADIGGGNGSQMIGILQRFGTLSGIVFDLPHVVEGAEEAIRRADLSQRCELVGGSFFESVPEGADVYLLRHIIHDWSESEALTILRNCHSAMAENGKLLVVESVIPLGNEPFGGKFLDLVMLLIPGGKERTEEEYRELFREAGFRLNQIIPTDTEVSILEAVKE